jgi:hypothetical protein
MVLPTQLCMRCNRCLDRIIFDNAADPSSRNLIRQLNSEYSPLHATQRGWQCPLPHDIRGPHRIQGSTRSTISVASRVYRSRAGGGVVKFQAFCGTLSHHTDLETQKGMGGAISAHGYRLSCTTSVQQPMAQSSPSCLRGISGEEINNGHEPCHKNLPRSGFTLNSNSAYSANDRLPIIPSPVFVSSWLAGADISATY